MGVVLLAVEDLDAPFLDCTPVEVPWMRLIDEWHQKYRCDRCNVTIKGFATASLHATDDAIRAWSWD